MKEQDMFLPFYHKSQFCFKYRSNFRGCKRSKFHVYHMRKKIIETLKKNNPVLKIEKNEAFQFNHKETLT